MLWEVKCNVFASEAAATAARDSIAAPTTGLAGIKVLAWDLTPVIAALSASDATSTPQPTPELVAVPLVGKQRFAAPGAVELYRQRRDTITNPLDLVFVIDGSGSIGLGGYTQLLALATDFVDALTIGENEVR